MVEMRSELDMVDGQKFENLINQDFADFNEKFTHMSIKQKTSYFVSNITNNNYIDHQLCPNEHMSLPNSCD